MEAYRLKLFKQMFHDSVINGENVLAVEENATVLLNLATGKVQVTRNNTMHESSCIVEEHDQIEQWLYEKLK